MITIYCAIPERRSVFPVDIGISQTIGHLKKKIKEEKPDTVRFEADLLKLYLARDGGAWLNSNDEDIKALKRGEVTDRIKNLMQEQLLLDETWNLNNEVYFGEEFERAQGDIHVLVEMPEAVQREISSVQEVLPINPPTAQHERNQIPHVQIFQDSLNLNVPHLARDDLVERIYLTLDTRTRFILFNSPAGSGKTSLLALFAHRYQRIHCIPVSFLDIYRSGFDLLLGIGIDLKKQQTNLSDDTDHIVMIDDAQTKYEDASFWNILIKTTSWLPGNIRFIISATHALKGGIASPVFDSINAKFVRKDFLLEDAEAAKFLQLDGTGLPFNMRKPNFMQLLIRECNGLIGALRVSVNSVATYFRKNIDPFEDELIGYFLSQEFLNQMARCFGSQHMTITSPELKDFLIKCLTEGPNFHSDDLGSLVTSLEKAGILARSQEESSVKFSSPLAEKYYSKWLFPNRALFNPHCLHDLIKQVISNMSASALRKSVVHATEFPNEGTFQHQFWEGLALNTTSACSICPELGRVFPVSASGVSERINGEIDFYLNGKLRWGIELLVNGHGIQEHIDRFKFSKNGKYVSLGAKDYAVVDLRGNMSGKVTNVRRHPKRITVFLKLSDFSTCECIFGNASSSVHITLKN